MDGQTDTLTEVPIVGQQSSLQLSIASKFTNGFQGGQSIAKESACDSTGNLQISTNGVLMIAPSYKKRGRGEDLAVGSLSTKKRLVWYPEEPKI